MRTETLPPRGLADLIHQQAATQPDRWAVLAPGRSPLTFADLWHQICDVGTSLRSLGVDRSARVAVVLPNGPEMAVAFLGVAAHAACVPLNPAYTASELRLHLASSRARVVIVPKGENGAIHAVADDMALTLVEIEADDSLQAGRFRMARMPVRSQMTSSFPADSDTALVLHTSGTTGRAKVVPLSHAELVNYAVKLSRHLGLGQTDRCLNVMPLFHSHGLRGALLSSLASGGGVICAPGFEDRAFFDWIAEYQPTWYTAVPTIHQAVIAHGSLYRQRAPNHRFRFVRSTSAALPAVTMKALKDLFGAPVITAYGMAEASPISSTALLPGKGAPGSVGIPSPGMAVAIMDESSHLLATGRIGEIVVRGDGVFKGYENNPEANALAFIDGWFRTGDQGYLDENGYLYVSGRLKEVVNRGGEKIAPREVDEALLEHHAVQEAAAFAVAHPTLGEDLLAAVVRRAGADIDGAMLRTFLAQKLAAFKVPSQILLTDEIPRGPTGKVQRHRLHELLAHLVHRPFVAPRDDVERQLAEIWKSLLGISDIGIDDDFFALGGDSLLAVSAFVDIEARLGKTLRLATLFDAPTIRQLAEVICGDDGPAGASTVVPIQTKGELPPLFFMSGWGAQILVFADLTHHLGDEQPFYAIDPTIIEVGSGETLTVEQVAARVIEDMRRFQPTGPYNLAGFSMGGKFVWEIAQQLNRAGEKVSLLTLLDTAAPGFPIPRPFLVRTALHLRHALALKPAEALAYLRERVLALRRYLAPRRRTLFGDSNGDRIGASPLAQRLERATQAMYDASKRYVPSAYPGRMTLVRAAHQPIRPGMDDTDPLMGWGQLAQGGVAVQTMHCAHSEMLEASHAPELASVLSQLIQMFGAQTLPARARQDDQSRENLLVAHTAPTRATKKLAHSPR